MSGLTAHFVVRNEPLIYYAVKSVYDWCSEILLDDTGSSDTTLGDIETLLSEDKDRRIIFKKTPIATNELMWTARNWHGEQKKNKGKFGVGAVRDHQLKRTRTPYFIIVDGDETYYETSAYAIHKVLEAWPAGKVCGRVGIRWMFDDKRFYHNTPTVGRVFKTDVTSMGVQDSPGEMATHRKTGEVISSDSKYCFTIPNTSYLHWEKFLKPWRRTIPFKTVQVLEEPYPEVMQKRPEFLARFLKTVGRDPALIWVGHPPSPEEYMKGIVNSCFAVGLDPKGANLLHIGAHLGQEDPLYAKAGIEPCYVEPNPDAFNQLVKAYPKRKCWNRAVGDKEGRMPFYLYSPNECSSFLKRTEALKHIYPHVKEVGKIGVRVSPADALMAEYGKPFDIVVIDTQGAELGVLKGASKVLETAKVVMCELYHESFYAGCSLSHEVDAYFASKGFVKFWEAAGSSDCWGDAIYIRRGA